MLGTPAVTDTLMMFQLMVCVPAGWMAVFTDW